MFSRFAHKFHEKFISLSHTRETLNARFIFCPFVHFGPRALTSTHALAFACLRIPGARNSSRSVSKLFAKSLLLFTSNGTHTATAAAAAAANPNFQTGPIIIVLLLYRIVAHSFIIIYDMQPIQPHGGGHTQTRKCATNAGTTMTMHAPPEFIILFDDKANVYTIIIFCGA